MTSDRGDDGLFAAKASDAPTELVHDLYPPLKPSDLAEVRQAALHIVEGDIERSTFDGLSPELAPYIEHEVLNLIKISQSESVRRLESKNPFYSVYNPKIVYDGSAYRGHESYGEQ